jgi:mono/diheme cytochrome c family protein
LAADPCHDSSPARLEAVRIGVSASSRSCARCHGLEAVAGGGLGWHRAGSAQVRRRRTGIRQVAQRAACFKKADDEFIITVRRGRVRDGRVCMPPFEGTLAREAIRAVCSHGETVREP